MLSYRHGYHAGNHADVLKHMLLCLTLRFLNQKDKPYSIIDTHSGAGIYSLNSVFAQKNKEYLTGLNKVISNEIEKIPNEKVKIKLTDALKGIDEGKRDFKF